MLQTDDVIMLKKSCEIQNVHNYTSIWKQHIGFKLIYDYKLQRLQWWHYNKAIF